MFRKRSDRQAGPGGASRGARAFVCAIVILACIEMVCLTPATAQGERRQGNQTAKASETAPAKWPDVTNTGPPKDLVLKPSGEIIVTEPGTVISGVDVRGSVYIKAPNVTLMNCRVTSSGFAVVDIAAHVSGAVVQNCLIDGTGAAFDGTGNQGIQGQGTFRNNNIFNVENGITLQGHNSVIVGNYIHDLRAGGTPHYDGIQIDGGIENVEIRHNTIINSHGSASAVMIDNYFGPISNITVEDNLLAGGSFTIYSDASFTSHPIAGVSINNNRIAPGRYGATDFKNNLPIYRGNRTDGALLIRRLNLGPTGMVLK